MASLREAAKRHGRLQESEMRPPFSGPALVLSRSGADVAQLFVSEPKSGVTFAILLRTKLCCTCNKVLSAASSIQSSLRTSRADCALVYQNYGGTTTCWVSLRPGKPVVIQASGA
jgi:hypothetical protein